MPALRFSDPLVDVVTAPDTTVSDVQIGMDTFLITHLHGQ